MTVSILTVKAEYTGDGTENPLATTFEFWDSDEVVVVKRVTADGLETVLVEDTHYSVSGGDGSTGTVTPIDGDDNFPSTVTWMICRVTDLTQESDLGQTDPLPAETLEQTYDRLVHQIQEISERLDRALVIPVSEDPTLNMELPNSVNRESSYLGFDANKEPIALSAPTDTSLTTSFSEDLLDDDDAPTARATLNAQEDVIAARGSLVRGSAAGVAEELTVGNNGTLLGSDGTDVAHKTLESMLAFIPFPRDHLKGLGMTRVSATNISIAEGQCRAGSAANQNLINGVNAAAFTKDFDNGGWVAGTGNGGVPTAAGFAASAATWHYFMLVGTDGSVDFGYDTSLTAANLIADSDVIAALGATVYYRRLFSFESSAVPEIPDFNQRGDRFLLAVAADGYNDDGIDYTSGGVGPLTQALAGIPTGIPLVGLLRVLWDASTIGAYLIVGSLLETPITPDKTGLPLANLCCYDTSHPAAADMEIDLDTSGQLWIEAVTDTSSNLDIAIRGWVDRRGQDD